MLQTGSKHLPNGWELYRDRHANRDRERSFTIRVDGTVVANGVEWPKPKLTHYHSTRVELNETIRAHFLHKVAMDRIDFENRREAFLQQCAEEAAERARAASNAVLKSMRGMT